jgi:DNA-directed RNA polymerase specialized sigma24 family protein
VSDEPSVSRWLDGLKAGDAADIERLWSRYFEKLVRLAGSKLPGNALRSFDAEDVALSAFHSLCDRVGRGDYAALTDRDDFWRLLATIATRKAYAQVRHQTRQKRGGGRVMGESIFLELGDEGDGGFAAYLSREPTPDDAAQFTEDCERLLDKLGDPVLRAIAVGKLAGQSSEELAKQLQVSVRTIDRKLRVIRALWEEDAA